jgi:hexulose-6-phosphate isomerase
MEAAVSLGMNRIVVPFVDASAINNDSEVSEVVEVLRRALPAAHKSGVELHLETSLGPAAFAALMERVNDPMLKVNYDSGNSASLGYDVREEFAAYGKAIGSVHIKDRKLGAGTVPLGTGNADFPKLFEALEKINYRGDFTLQVARGTPGDEVAWAKENLAFVKTYLGQ